MALFLPIERSTVAQSELLKSQYRLKVSPTLIAQLAIEGVDPSSLVEFAHAQIQVMMECKPNCRIYAPKKIWVLRGYYPNTSVFFKLTLVKAEVENLNGTDSRYQYFARIKHLVVGSKRSWHANNFINYGEIVLDSERVRNYVTQGIENSILGAEHKQEPLIDVGNLKPRCMSPKGMRLFKSEDIDV